ncbi:hypothetical protein TNCT_323561 [Trichonephila clavata]|uniref:Uncharacterized protein n=1 Tax=Trichonephila clavata TaxID=2740835 RepID=A0A8X6GNV7_TRICU|nr:hypothetical protein TNCT_323561 [Trichonephila clavata]
MGEGDVEAGRSSDAGSREAQGELMVREGQARDEITKVELTLVKGREEVQCRLPHFTVNFITRMEHGRRDAHWNRGIYLNDRHHLHRRMMKARRSIF